VKKTYGFFLKKNNLAPIGRSLSFALTDKGIQWLGEVNISADTMITGGYKGTKSSEMVDVLRDMLSEQPRKSSEVIACAEELGISKRTLLSAKALLPIKSKKIGNQWYWELQNEKRE